MSMIEAIQRMMEVVRSRVDGAPQIDLAVPAFGYKNHVSIDRRHGLIRRWTISDAAAHDGARLAAVLDSQNTASDVWADTAYRSGKNEAMFRLLNENIQNIAATLGGDEAFQFICECATQGCFERVTLTLEEYERVREDGAERPGIAGVK